MNRTTYRGLAKPFPNFFQMTYIYITLISQEDKLVTCDPNTYGIYTLDLLLERKGDTTDYSREMVN